MWCFCTDINSHFHSVAAKRLKVHTDLFFTIFTPLHGFNQVNVDKHREFGKIAGLQNSNCVEATDKTKEIDQIPYREAELVIQQVDYKAEIEITTP